MEAFLSTSKAFCRQCEEGMNDPCEDRVAVGQKALPGHPVVLPRLRVWLAVLGGVLRGFTSLRAVWRF